MVKKIENDPNNRKGMVLLYSGDRRVVDAFKKVTQDLVFFHAKNRVFGYDTNEVKYYQMVKKNRQTRDGILGVVASIAGSVVIVLQIDNGNITSGTWF